jgi:hypothetical protein
MLRSIVYKEVSSVAKVARTIIINAPVEKLFSYINEPVNLPEIWPSMA